MHPIALAAVALALTCAVAVIPAGIHKVDEGTLSLYYVGGALSSSIGTPGYHWSAPIITSQVHIPISLQTERISNIECGTSGGVMVYFDTIEAVHRLLPTAVHDVVKEYGAEFATTWIHDRMHFEVNQLCSKHSLQEIYIDMFDDLDDLLLDRVNQALREWVPGLEVVAVRTTKPRIPSIILVNYEKQESTRAKLLVLQQQQKNTLKKAETERRTAVMEAQKQLEVSIIDSSRQVEQAASRLEISEIDAQMHVDRAREHANAMFYRLTKQAEVMQSVLTPQFLRLQEMKNTWRNTKVYWGDSVPDAIIEEGPYPSREAVQQRSGQLDTQTTTLHGAIKRHAS